MARNCQYHNCFTLMAFLLGLVLPFFLFSFAQADTCPDFTTMPYDDSISILSTATFDVYYGSWTYQPSATCPSDSWINPSQRKDYSERDTGSCWGYRIVSYSNMDCAPAIPPEDTNGVQDNGEDGIDCGGTTGVACVASCVEGKDSYTIEGVGSVCAYSIPPNSMGDCTAEYSFLVDGKCFDISSTSSTVLAAESVSVPNPETYIPPENPYNQSTVDVQTDIIRSTVTDPDGVVHDIETTTSSTTDTDGNTSSAVTSVDTATNLDGSTTVTTTTTTTTNGAGDSDSTSSVGTNVKEFDSDGNLVSESDTQQTEESDPEKDEDNPVGSPSGDGFMTGVDDIDFAPLVGALDVAANKWPFNVPNTMVGFYEMLDVEPVAPSFTLHMMGQDMTVDLSIFDTIASVLRFLVGTLITLGLFYYIVHFYRGVS